MVDRRIMDRNIFYIIFLCSCIFVLLPASTGQGAVLDKGPYMIYTGLNTEMKVLWQADDTAENSYIEWGTSPMYGNNSNKIAESGDRSRQHQYSFTLSKLVPGTRYYYRVWVDSNQYAGSLLAAPEDSTTKVTIYGYGDTRSNPEVHDQVTRAMLADIDADPDARQTLCLHSGDWNTSDTESNWQKGYFDRSSTNALTFQSNVPIMGARGNHEGSAAEYIKYWPYNGGHCYYSFDYGPVHVVVIDQYVDFSVGSEQYDWLVNDLKTSTKKFKIALYHQSAWSSEKNRSHTDSKKLLQPLFLKYGVQLAHNGHDHCYSRASVEGIQHIVSGGGGAPLHKVDDSFDYIKKAEATHHFMRYDIDGDLMKVFAIRADLTIIESFEVKFIPQKTYGKKIIENAILTK